MAIHAYFNCFIYFQTYIASVSFRRFKSRSRGSICGVAAACMWAHEMEQARGGPCACMGPCGIWSRMGEGRESWVRQADT
jgi:hypothetical protein